MPRPVNLRLWSAIAFSIVGYVLIGYILKRYETVPLLTAYMGVFLFYLYLVYQKVNLSIKQIIGLGIFFRLLFLLSVPALSNDFYRFIWDGRLWFNGINPFAELPTFYVGYPENAPNGITKELFSLLGNSQIHYTVYPPIPQFINWLAAWLAVNSIHWSAVIIRLSHIIAEAGTLFILPKLLKSFTLDEKQVIWYALNPLIIIELTGNLHHEALMIFFMVLFMAQWQQEKYAGAGFSLAMAVASKLLPLMFLPYILLKVKGMKRLVFIAVFSISLLIVFAPLLDASFFKGMEDSLLLYYQKFEFNAGIYYLFREIGFWAKGYNMIALIGKVFVWLATVLILAISITAYIKKWKPAEAFLWISTIFALFSLILHPWYIALVILFSTLTNYRFSILWSFLIMGTYAGYSATGFSEVYPTVAIEFISVIGFALFEWKRQANARATLKVAP